MVRNGRPTRIPISSPQRSVQIALIFRLLLKITVDWPYNATYMCLEPVRGHTIKTETNNQKEIQISVIIVNRRRQHRVRPHSSGRFQ